MTEKERLLDHLFVHKDREHVNIKFFRAASDFKSASVEEFCEAVNNALLQVDSGVAKPMSEFPEAFTSVDIDKIIAAA